MDAAPAAALAAGFFGGVHCIGMCGGIGAALSGASRGSPGQRVLAFNAGRITSYACAGALAGSLGGLAKVAVPLQAAQTGLLFVASAFMVLLGLYVAGWGQALLRFEGVGAGLWRRTLPLRSRVMPIDSHGRAFTAGVLWGWLPCGIVYGMLVLAVASGSAFEGARVMAAFGLGTLPAMLAAGLAAQRLLAWRRQPWVRRIAGLAIVALAIAALGRVPAVTDILAAAWVCLQ